MTIHHSQDDLLAVRGVARLVVHRTVSGSTNSEMILPVLLEPWMSALDTATAAQQRDGPRRLRDYDDDDGDNARRCSFHTRRICNRTSTQPLAQTGEDVANATSWSVSLVVGPSSRYGDGDRAR